MDFIDKLLVYTNKITFMKEKLKQKLIESNELQLKMIEKLPQEILNNMRIPFAECSSHQDILEFTYDSYYKQKNIIENDFKQFDNHKVYDIQVVKSSIKTYIFKMFESKLNDFSKSFSSKEAYELKKELLKDIDEDFLK